MWTRNISPLIQLEREPYYYKYIVNEKFNAADPRWQPGLEISTQLSHLMMSNPNPNPNPDPKGNSN